VHSDLTSSETPHWIKLEEVMVHLVEIMLCTCFPNDDDMLTCVKSEVQFPRFLKLDTRLKWIVRFRGPETHSTGGCMGPRAGADAVTIKKVLCHCQESNYDLTSRSLVNVGYWVSLSGSDHGSEKWDLVDIKSRHLLTLILLRS
jgi:hypothetical protein